MWPRHGAVRRAPNEGARASFVRRATISDRLARSSFACILTRVACVRVCVINLEETSRASYFVDQHVRFSNLPGVFSPLHHPPPPGLIDEREREREERALFDSMLGSSQRRCVDRWVVTIDLFSRHCLIIRLYFAMIQQYPVSTFILLCSREKCSPLFHFAEIMEDRMSKARANLNIIYEKIHPLIINESSKNPCRTIKYRIFIL